MKKLNILNVLCAAVALSFVFLSCNGLVDTGEGASAVVAEDGKIAVKVSASESYRTIISTLPSDISYELSIAGKADTATADVAKSYTLSSLSDSPFLYLDAGTYTFTLTGTSGEKAIVSGSTEKTISTSDANVAISLNAVTGEAVSVTLNLTVPGASDYGLDSVEAAVYDDASLATDSSDSLTVASAESGYTVSGTVTSGANKWVKLTLKDSDGTVIGSKTEALFAISNAAISADVTAQASQYKATIVLTASEAKALTLKNSAVTSTSYTGIALAASEATGSSGTYTYTKYIPVGSYGIYCDGNSIGTVSSVTTATADAGKYLTSISAAWNTTEGTQPTFYTSSTIGDVLEAISITETYSDNSTDTVAAKESGKEAVVSVEGFSQESTDAQTLTLSYNGKTTTISVTLTAVALKSISVSANDGEELTYAFEATEPTWTDVLTVTAHYNDGDKVVTDYTVTGWDSSSSGEKTLTVTFGEETATFTVTINAKVLTVYALEGDSATISLGKTQVGKIGDDVNNEANQYLTVKTDNWSSSQTLGGFEDVFYNLASGDSRNLTAKVSGVAAFTVYVKNSTADRTFTVKIGSADAITVTHPGKKTIDNTETDVIPFTFNTGTTDETSIVLGGGSNSVYPGYMILYSTAQIIPVESVTISGAPEANVLLASGSVQLTATVSPERATAKTITWTSSDEDTATVDSTGLVTYKAAGTVTITAMAESGVKADASITIQASEVKVTAISVTDTSSATSGSVNAGDTLHLTATVTPNDASNKAVTWTSSNTDAATVDENGLVTAVAAGSSTITATAADGSSVTGTYTVTVQSVMTATYFAGYTSESTLSWNATVTDGLGTASAATFSKSLGSITADPALGEAKTGYGYGVVVTTTEKIAKSVDSGSEIWNVTFTVKPNQDVTLTKVAADSVCNKTSNYTLSVYLGGTKIASQDGSSNVANISSAVSKALTANTEYTFKVAFETKGKDINAGPFSLSNVGLTFAKAD